MNNQSVAEIMAARHSAKKFDPQFAISDKDLQQITEAIRMAPASYGLFDVRIVVVKRGKLLDELSQVIDAPNKYVNFAQASAYIFFITDTHNKIAQTIKGTAAAIADGNQQMAEGYIDRVSKAVEKKMALDSTGRGVDSWIARQAYIGLGVGIVAANQIGLDTSPQEVPVEEPILTRIFVEKNLMRNDEQIVVGLGLGRIDGQQPDAFRNPKRRLSESEFTYIVK